jgi:hypothetical protein
MVPPAGDVRVMTGVGALSTVTVVFAVSVLQLVARTVSFTLMVNVPALPVFTCTEAVLLMPPTKVGPADKVHT